MMKTIKVTEVHEMLSEIGSKKDTYNDIILKLINTYKTSIMKNLKMIKQTSITNASKK